MNRKHFLQSVSLGLGGLFLPKILTAKNSQRPAPIESAIVKTFVGASHGNYDKMYELHQEHPNLLNASWDWGGGDFETGIGAAGHVGNKKIANYLLEHGTRTNIFVLTMLGKTTLVKAMLEAYPQFLNAPGPHGFTLLHHAKVGKENAEELFEFLKSKGAKEMQVRLF